LTSKDIIIADTAGSLSSDASLARACAAAEVDRRSRIEGGPMALSARNHLKGIVEEIQLGDVVAPRSLV
jgi:hypothetical protein